MKKLSLLLFAAMLLPMAMGAQTGLLQRAGTPLKTNSRHMAPAQVTLGENQKIMGHYDTDDVASTNEGLGLTGLPGVIPIATVLDPSELAVFQGGKIVAFRVGLAAATPVTRVFVAPVSAAGVPSGIGAMTEWSCNVSNAGWNEITLETPYEINLDGNTSLMIGFDYAQTSSNYPISAVTVGTIYPSYCYIKSGRKYTWENVGLDSYGNLSVQCIVESDNYPDYQLQMANLKVANYVKAGQDMNFTFDVRNSGIKDIEVGAVGFDVMIDGEKVSSLTNDAVISSQFVDLQGTVAIPQDLESGSHTLSVVMNSLNGEALTEAQTVERSFILYANGYPRQKHMVEQLTSTYCTYCPLGNSLLNILTTQRDDIIWVGLHGNLGSGVDPFRCDQADTIMAYMTGGSISYPSGVFDRSTGWEDDVNIANGLGYYEQYHSQVASELGVFFDYITEMTPTFATINGRCKLNDNVAEVVISGEMTPDFDVMMGENAKLNVYIVEDGLVAPQLNAGTWINDYTHNGVFRVALGSVFGVAFNKDGDSYSNSFEFTIPEGWNKDNLRVVAFISRPLSNGGGGAFGDMYIDNADVFNFNTSEGVDELLIEEDAVPVGYYDVTGRQTNGLQQGINIVKMSNGTAKKVLVK